MATSQPQHPAIERIQKSLPDAAAAAFTPQDGDGSADWTPPSGAGDSDLAIGAGMGTGTSTPLSTASDGASGSGTRTPGSDSGGELVATSTVTTEYTRRSKHGQDGAAEDYISAGGAAPPAKPPQTTTVTHVGAKALEHQIDKDGGVHLKPQQSAQAKRKGKKIRALFSFKPRQSRFDRFNEEAAKDP